MDERSVDARPYGHLQFGIRHLLIVTTAVAMFCLLGTDFGWRVMFVASHVVAPTVFVAHFVRSNGK